MAFRPTPADLVTVDGLRASKGAWGHIGLTPCAWNLTRSLGYRGGQGLNFERTDMPPVVTRRRLRISNCDVGQFLRPPIGTLSHRP